MEIVFGYFVKTLVLPPGINLFSALFAIIFLRRFAQLRRLVIGIAFATLWIWCTPFVASWHARLIEIHPALDSSAPVDADAIVILAGARKHQAPEYGGRDSIGSDTLERIRYGAKLSRDLDLPVAVAGGAVLDLKSLPLGQLMAESLQDEFNIEVSWSEEKSRNTAENARFSREVLPVTRIVLVTHAIHMSRALTAFENVGFAVVPAPMGFNAGAYTTYGLFDWLPSVSALVACRAVLHEWLGMAFYKLRY
ncbi:MAG: uncharacterized SAM-binding protein YcdF (DUF218 family) [Gammaproteobacteria bacterium]|jgi:uncharacterized SAM-binding protein YcdF (DUF218 family)